MKRKQSMKDIRIGISILLSLLVVFANGVFSVEATTSDKAMIKKAIENNLQNDEKVKKFFYMDFDKNGRKEAFVLTGEKNVNKYEDATNTLWFAYCKNGKAVVSAVDHKVMYLSSILKLKSQTLMCKETFSVTSTPQVLYKVHGNSVKEIFSGESIKKLKGNNFISVKSAYDCVKESTGEMNGHSYKEYYYYYKNGKVYEYKAVKISKKDFKNKYSNANKVLKKYKKFGKVIDILIRSNKKVHINYKKYTAKTGQTTFDNVTFTAKGKRLVKPKENGGTYKTTTL